MAKSTDQPFEALPHLTEKETEQILSKDHGDDDPESTTSGNAVLVAPASPALQSSQAISAELQTSLDEQLRSLVDKPEQVDNGEAAAGSRPRRQRRAPERFREEPTNKRKPGDEPVRPDGTKKAKAARKDNNNGSPAEGVRLQFLGDRRESDKKQRELEVLMFFAKDGMGPQKDTALQRLWNLVEPQPEAPSRVEAPRPAPRVVAVIEDEDDEEEEELLRSSDL
ncbi:hypothetical protein HDU87_006025 [Geranomyces variabilis]|uniref:Uncharacterized protein n=1 Tax=Geranomyces variabilis TaxID=109894 RepID=A0AAD5XQ92_9FUNG|nr:hypothetical protein HDU87_006025 [Geranomyces variabilis]